MVKIDIENYIEAGLGDIYYGMLTFISKYITENFDPLENINSELSSNYAIALDSMKKSLKELLDYFKTHRKIYLDNIDQEVDLDSLTIQEQAALEEKCKEYIMVNLNTLMNSMSENNPKKI